MPTGIKFFNWTGTSWRPVDLRVTHAVRRGFMVTLPVGGLTGVLLCKPPLDFHVTDSYSLWRFHYVLFGTIVFAYLCRVYFWFPKMTRPVVG